MKSNWSINNNLAFTDLSFSSNITKSQKEFKELGNCRQYCLNPDFVSCLIRALLTGQSPPVGQGDYQRRVIGVTSTTLWNFLFEDCNRRFLVTRNIPHR